MANTQQILKTVYIVLLVMVIFMHMNVSGIKVFTLFFGIFTSANGIVIFLSEILKWAWNFIYNPQFIYMTGTFIILWFVGLPMLTRYKFITTKSTPLLAVVLTLYIFLGLRLFNVLP